ncbi:alcohol dehydrogenase class IV [Rhodoligotrophos appendicifer]|uniref:iron-containing alcohol dehydrogenase n=1 Tax=Rhodoligotrophos appendicifer TaxID=987056 RepID=UPI0014790F00|nr:iron-containing alcohol dehydrogenase [Rhodoligotrophos appendicifer]
MTPFTLSRTPEILAGPGAVASLAERLTALAGPAARIVLLADPALARLGITTRIARQLADAGHRPLTLQAAPGEPKAADIDAATEDARAHGATAIIGLGGGSALDTAKLLAATAASGNPVADYAFCATPLPAAPLALIAIPTTAGTGSEVTATCVFTDARKIKAWAWGDALKPRLAILDPELTVALPPAITAATGLDALVHAIEAATGRRRFAANDLYAHAAIRLISGSFERALAQPHDLDARFAMLLGSTYAGLAIDNAGTAIAHTIAHALAALAPVPHGRATAMGMAASMAWAVSGAPDAFAAVALAMGGPAEADVAVDRFLRLIEASALDLSLAGDGISLNRPDLLADQMRSPENAPMRANTAREVTDADIDTLARAVYALA